MHIQSTDVLPASNAFPGAQSHQLQLGGNVSAVVGSGGVIGPGAARAGSAFVAYQRPAALAGISGNGAASHADVSGVLAPQDGAAPRLYRPRPMSPAFSPRQLLHDSPPVADMPG